MEVSWSSYRQRLLALAPEVPVRNNITVAFYYRSFYTYREQARQSLENFQYEQAFIYLLRCANLATQTIPSHKDYNEEKFSRDRKKIKLILPNIVDSLEKVSSILQQRYDNYDAYLEENKTAESDSQTNSVDVIESRDTFETIEGVQNIRYPSDLLDKFISISHRNTLEDVETCGILAGVLSGSEYRITTLIVPKQSGTANTVEMLDEEEVIDVQVSRGLLTLGWIHTHPTQDAFLSSVDLHTQFGYQVMLPEAIAIVVAPSKEINYGVFSITDKGMDILARCELRGFHKHDDSFALYGQAAHALVDDGQHSRIDVVNIREM